jgi:hypothetical protein
MAQEIPCKKMDVGLVQAEKGGQARDRFLRLFDASLPDEAIEAIEDQSHK